VVLLVAATTRMATMTKDDEDGEDDDTKAATRKTAVSVAAFNAFVSLFSVLNSRRTCRSSYLGFNLINFIIFDCPADDYSWSWSKVPERTPEV
jgi:hypothetical protein